MENNILFFSIVDHYLGFFFNLEKSPKILKWGTLGIFNFFFDTLFCWREYYSAI